jgi:hypothetical protein
VQAQVLRLGLALQVLSPRALQQVPVNLASLLLALLLPPLALALAQVLARLVELPPAPPLPVQAQALAHLVEALRVLSPPALQQELAKLALLPPAPVQVQDRVLNQLVELTQALLVQARGRLLVQLPEALQALAQEVRAQQGVLELTLVQLRVLAQRHVRLGLEQPLGRLLVCQLRVLLRVL